MAKNLAKNLAKNEPPVAPSRWLLELALLCGSGVLAALFFFLFFSRGEMDFAIPLNYRRDSLIAIAFGRMLIDGDWFPFTSMASQRLGAPFGSVMADFPVPEHLHILIFKVVALFTDSAFVALNVFYFLGFPFAAMAMVWLLRRLRVSAELSIVGGLLYAFVPFHFLRYNHILLAAYWAVPVMCHVLFAFFREGTPLFPWNRRSYGYLAIAFSGVFFGLYYAFFFVLLLGAAVLWQRSRQRFIAAGILAACVLAGALVSTIPTLLFKAKNGSNPAAAQRFAYEADLYGLKLANLIVPSGTSRIGLLNDLKAKYKSGTPQYEGTDESLGLFGAIALLALIAVVLWPVSTGNTFRRFLGMLCLVAIIYATIGGVASLISAWISPVIRSTNRISVFIACFVFAALMQWGDAWLAKLKSSAARYTAAMLFGLVALFELVPASAKVDMSFRTEFESDRRFFKQVEDKLPAGAAILQLPYECFPECAPVHQMDNTAQLKGFVHTRTLRWSFAAINGRPDAERIRRLSQSPLNVAEITAAGYSAIYVDRSGFPDSGQAVLQQLQPYAKEVIGSEDRRLLLIRL